MNFKNTHIMYTKISPNLDIDYESYESDSDEFIEREEREDAQKKEKKAKKKEKKKRQKKLTNPDIKKSSSRPKSKNFQKADSKQNIKKNKIITHTKRVSKLEIVQKIQLYSLDDVDIRNISENTFQEFFPLILAYVRKLTKVLNDDPFSLMAIGIKKKWNPIVSAVIERIQNNHQLGLLACWLEEKKLGLQVHVKEKYQGMQNYNVKPFYKSKQFFETRTFFIELGGKITKLCYGDEISVSIRNPLCQENSIITNIFVEKIFSSKAKPVLLSIESLEASTITSMIFKKGGDTRKDMLVQVIFKIFNSLWENSPFNKEDTPYIFGYKVIPLTHKYTAVEYVEGCDSASSFKWKKFQFMDHSDLNRFIVTAAGAYIASWVIGIRDRHQDNMLIKDDKVFFNIDFEHIFNQKTKFNDAPRFAIHDAMKSELLKLNQWERFKTLVAEGFSVLQSHSSMIINVCSLLFKPVYKNQMNQVTNFLSESLMVGKSTSAAQEYIKILCDKGAASIFKTIKFMAHDIAVDRRTSNRNNERSFGSLNRDPYKSSTSGENNRDSREKKNKSLGRKDSIHTFLKSENGDIEFLIQEQRKNVSTKTSPPELGSSHAQRRRKSDNPRRTVSASETMLVDILEKKEKKKKRSKRKIKVITTEDIGSLPETEQKQEQSESSSSGINNAVSEITINED